MSLWGFGAVVTTYNHNLSEIVSQLDAKIAALQSKQSEIQAALTRNPSITLNSAALLQASESLAAAQVARESLQFSCCNQQNCNIEWDES